MIDFSLYSHALAALALWAIMVPVLAATATRGTINRAPCGKPVRDYDDPCYRRERALQNALEMSGPYIAATLAAVLTGGAPLLVNLLASLFIVARIAMAYVHTATTNQPARSAFWFLSTLCVLGLALTALYGAFA